MVKVPLVLAISTMSYIVNGNITLTNMKKRVYKKYLTPSKCKKYVLWDAWNAILVHIMTKLPMYIFFIESNLTTFTPKTKLLVANKGTVHITDFLFVVRS